VSRLATQIRLTMTRTHVFLIGLAATAIATWLIWRQQMANVREPNDRERRVKTARAARQAAIRERFRQAGLAYPPRELFLRAFKHEAELELWARENDESFRLVTTWRIVAASGRPGPKRREGDRQVPEGFYVVDRFNPESSYHLSLGLNYPNASDRLRGDRDHPGSDIFIHGSDHTIGCLPLGDRAIEELYLIALDAHHRGQREIAVHIFPARMAGATWNDLARAESAANPKLKDFWEELRPAYEAFERTRRVPAVRVEPDGAYRMETEE
jgi:murein L,D-transpeptidase YafK